MYSTNLFTDFAKCLHPLPTIILLVLQQPIISQAPPLSRRPRP